MKQYFINYGTGAGDETVNGTLADAKKAADAGAAYTQQPIKITDDDGEVVATRYWYGVAYDSDNDDCSDPIEFGEFGFYADWVEG